MFLREVCCILGVFVKDVKRNLPVLVQSSSLYLLRLFHVGSDGAAISLRAIEVFQGLGITG